MTDFEVTAIILAGGMGTRLKNSAIPKCLTEIAGRPTIEYILDQIDNANIKNTLVTTFHLSQKIEEWLETSQEKYSTSITLVKEEVLAGTRVSLLTALRQVKTPFALVLLGDVIFSSPVDEFLSTWVSTDSDVGIVTYVNSYMDTCDLISVNKDGIQFVSKNNPKLFLPSVSALSGILVAKTNYLLLALERSQDSDFESALLKESIANNTLHVFPSIDWISDIGTPERLASTLKTFDRIYDESNRKFLTNRTLVLIDRDDTLIRDPNFDLTKPPEFIDGVLEFIRSCNSSAIPIIIVTNQSKIGRGEVSAEMHDSFIHSLNKSLLDKSLYVNDYFFCPHNPTSEVCECRKPKAGMFHLINEKYMNFKKFRSIMIGDSKADFEFAQNLGIDFVHFVFAKNCTIQTHHQCFVNWNSITRFLDLQP